MNRQVTITDMRVWLKKAYLVEAYKARKFSVMAKATGNSGYSKLATKHAAASEAFEAAYFSALGNPTLLRRRGEYESK